MSIFFILSGFVDDLISNLLKNAIFTLITRDPLWLSTTIKYDELLLKHSSLVQSAY